MLRKLVAADLESLVRIEQSAHVVPWNRETFQLCFESGYLGWALEADNSFAGFVIVSIRLEECHVLNLCVERQAQRKGYGRTLMEHALAQAKRLGAGIVYLEVRRSNTHAISLYRKMKFLEIGERKDYYPMPQGNEDALVFAKSL